MGDIFRRVRSRAARLNQPPASEGLEALVEKVTGRPVEYENDVITVAQLRPIVAEIERRLAVCREAVVEKAYREGWDAANDENGYIYQDDAWRHSAARKEIEASQ